MSTLAGRIVIVTSRQTEGSTNVARTVHRQLLRRRRHGRPGLICRAARNRAVLRAAGPGTPAYVEFRIGDYQHELGIIDTRFAPHRRPGTAAGAVIYWHVDDVRGAFDRLISMGATVHQEPVERGPGFVTASVIDPFGNILGVMYNQHYLEVLGS